MAKKDWMIIESELDEDQIKVLMATNDKSCVVSGVQAVENLSWH